jgi:hypothetical protein
LALALVVPVELLYGRWCRRPGEVDEQDLSLDGRLGEDVALVHGCGVDLQHGLLGTPPEVVGQALVELLHQLLVSQRRGGVVA